MYIALLVAAIYLAIGIILDIICHTFGGFSYYGKWRRIITAHIVEIIIWLPFYTVLCIIIPLSQWYMSKRGGWEDPGDDGMDEREDNKSH